jgi:dipeptidase
VRLALERARTAREACGVIAKLIEEHGQGGSGFADLTWPYHNSFLAADAEDAYVLEASARHWALKRLSEGGSASNHVTIGSDWDVLSADCVEHALGEGWWSDGSDRFDFAAAYRDATTIPPVVSSGRHRTTCGALAISSGALEIASFKRVLRDHYDSGDVHVPGRMPDDERFFSVCMHSGAVGVTAASMIVELAPPAPLPLVCWVSFCNPCIAPYLPVFPEAPLPDDFTRGGREPASGGAWWRFKRLLIAVEADFPRHGRRVREAWDGFEREMEAETERRLDEAGRESGAARRTTLERFMADAWAEASLRLDALVREIEG